MQEEIKDPKAKGGKGAKAEVTTQLFEGKDTTRYKEIAENVSKQIQVIYGNEDTPNKTVDLIQLVSDDQTLVSLFIERLCLEYDTPPPTKDEVEKQMRENIKKKADLLEQLEEARGAEAGEADPKAKAPAKGGAKVTKSVAEFEEEIQALMSVDVNGWVLLDFPRTINQAKMLEHLLTGYKSITDSEKPFDSSNFEVWTKFADHE